MTLRSATSTFIRAFRARQEAPHSVGMRTCLSGLAARGFRPASILDVGAASGGWTELALEFWPEARCFLVEPVQEQLELLEARLRSHRNLTVLPLALGSEAGEGTIGVDPTFLDGSSIVYESGRSRLVPVTTIDCLLATGRIDQPQFIKIDVQGYELEVLKGGEASLRSCPLVLVEVEFRRFAPAMPLVHEVISWLTRRGYQVYEVADVLRRPIDGAMGQCDLLFCREGHELLRSSEWGPLPHPTVSADTRVRPGSR